ncbi:MAG: acetyl-CoA C-acyltransferase [Gammaproteobacteria bacterium]|nr:MAG: acetyl-CoA C-acyltransferase [Gammaproteobacteria bacterium]
MSDVYIYSARRTPVGAFNGSLASVPATRLGSLSIAAALQDSGFSAEQVDQCIMGNVLTSGNGQAPAKQASLGAGLPDSVSCLTINKVCGSGLKAVMLGADAIRLQAAKVAVVGGMENMSLSPHLMSKSRRGYRMGPVTLEDALIKDGLWDPYSNQHMGNLAEMCARENKLSRQAQDEFATRSYEKALAAQADGLFDKEMVAVEIKTRRGSTSVSEDEEPKKVKFDKIPTLRPAFEKTGTITAANASKINDGAAALVIADQSLASETSAKPLARIIGYTAFSHAPEWFTTAPIYAMQNLLKKANKQASDIDLYEINEAFSVVTMAAQNALALTDEQINVHGGAVALGHPIGASGARILTTLAHALHTQDKTLGMASLCIGGGEAVAILIERV